MTLFECPIKWFVIHQGAVISIIHIKDEDVQISTCILNQYLKQYSGQGTILTVSVFIISYNTLVLVFVV